METKYFSPSINIVRDKDQELFYIPTRNGENAFRKIVNAYQQGTKSFNIIGAYGSGKSAFLLAFERMINKKADYFSYSFNSAVNKFDTHFIVGEYNSFKTVFCKSFNINPSEDIFNKLIQKREDEVGLLLVIDEFGKFLEFAAKENPDEELYFIQQLAEFVNSPQSNTFFITTLHQAFEDYALELSKAQRKEWDKVKGRLIEVAFNEPVEQLLFLASERIQQKNLPCTFSEKDRKILFEAISNADAFPLRDYFSLDFADKLFPFDILSASIITLSFQAYGQNERSLFSFLESQDYLALNDFTDGHTYYNIALAYDYLIYNFHSLLTSRYNPHSVQWRSITEAIERAESTINHGLLDALKLLKTIGLLSIFGRAGQKIDQTFLNSYSKIALGISNPDEIIDLLEQRQIIRYRIYNQRYVLFKGTDLDINTELELAEGVLPKDLSLVKELTDHFNFPIIPAKKIFYAKGTPRYFLFDLTEDVTQKIPEGAIDGFINIVFNQIGDENKLKEISKESNEAILFGFYQASEALSKQLYEIKKIEYVKRKCEDDEIANNELNDQLIAEEEKLNQLFIRSFYGEKAKVHWFYKGDQLIFKSPKELNQKLSEICDLVYNGTPKFLNELINREKLTSTISAAKNKLIKQALEFPTLEMLGFEEERFPPEKSIYLSLLKETGIHSNINENWNFYYPVEPSFNELWRVSENFLHSCSIAPRKLNELIEILKTKPLKLKYGFIEFWIPLFLIVKKHYFAFYENDEFVPDLTSDTLEVAMKQPQKYRISFFQLDKPKLEIFNRYRFFLNQIQDSEPTKETFIETIKPFLSFYKRLVPYTQQTKNLTDEAIRLKEALTNATKPEKVFFEDIPRALRYGLNDFTKDNRLEDFTISLQNVTRELSSAFANLVNRIEGHINTTIGSQQLTFPENKLELQKRFTKIRKEQLKPKLLVLLQRINSPLDDRQSWLSSIATAIINKTPDKFNDDDEIAFKSLFPQYIADLDNLTEISKTDIDEEREEVLKLEVTSFVKGVQKHLIRMPKSKAESIQKKKVIIRDLLDKNDRQANIALLLRLLQEEIDNE